MYETERILQMIIKQKEKIKRRRTKILDIHIQCGICSHHGAKHEHFDDKQRLKIAQVF